MLRTRATLAFVMTITVTTITTLRTTVTALTTLRTVTALTTTLLRLYITLGLLNEYTV